ncbi:MAG: hypothetical protein CL526_04620 [Aequorivita sp.]|nr:hypothetical protein [Aequorivita sp.]|tara:strand:- start:18725 stop:21739 length:3015 start_codon:yes stop_codon:yes gene_type:complete
MVKNFLILSLLFTISISSFSQQSAVYTNKYAEFNRALQLYNNAQYLAAQNLFAKIQNSSTDQTIKSDCAYYIANAAVRLNQQNADQLMESFVENYPTSLKRNSAFIDVANFYFENGKYSHAQKWYEKVDESSLSGSEQEKYNFNNGYVYFKAKRYNQAKQFFNKVSTSQQYGSQAKYYLGFMAYESDDYEEANKNFAEVKGEDRYSEDLSYYQADMNFKLGNFQKAIELGKEQFDKSNPQEQSQLSKIIGESYFNLEKYAEAIPYLKEYKGFRGKWNNTDYYQLGYAYYKQNKFENAIGEFNKIIDGRNAVAQNAYYHLAESYLQLDQKQQALNAFKNASEMDFSTTIQEDAFLNYARLSYEIGNSYQSTPQVLLSFIEKYPKNPNNDEIKDLLIDSYITSKNYKEAIELLENNKNFNDKSAYQKVAFYRGIELYNEANYNDAIVYFNKSLKEPQDASFTARATYWKAESNYQLSRFETSLADYKTFSQLPAKNNIPESAHLSYNLAYNYFKHKNYPEAIAHFKDYVNSASAENVRKKDAFLRLGDSYFVTSQYWPAMENYNAAIALSGANDYAHFQKAISYGFVDRTATKIEELIAFIKTYPNSVYRDDALYELGNTYVATNRNKEAVLIYDQLVNEIPQSSFVAKALLKKALIFENTNRSAEALQIFKSVAQRYPSTSEALQAVSSAKLIYIDQGNVDDYAAWVKTLNYIQIGDTELDDAAYAAAEQPYLENKQNTAKNRFEDYLKQFPNGLHAKNAHFYLGQIYFSEEKNDKAISHYEFVVSKERSEFTEQALARVSELYLNKEEYSKALTYLKRLETEADFPQNIIFAQTNIMKAAYELKQYTEAVNYAEKVLENAKIDNFIKSDAQVIIARSAMKTNNEEKAKTAYAEVAKIATGQLAAEALYYNAYFKNKEGDFKGSNVAIQKLAKDYSAYKLYGAKGLVLMAKNFYQLNDAYQATYILESVIKNFTDYPEIVSEAETELSSIKNTEAKTNASVETGN